MTTKQLDSTILSTLREFSSDSRTAGRLPLLCDFGAFFVRRTGQRLKSAVAGALAVSETEPGLVKRHLAAVPGVELFSVKLQNCIRLAPGASSVPSSVEQRPVDSSDAPPDEECRLVLLRGGELPDDLRDRLLSSESDGRRTLEEIESWAKKGRALWATAATMVAQGENKAGFAFDILKREVIAHLGNLFNESRRLDVAWTILEPFFREAPEAPCDSESAHLLFNVRKFASWDPREPEFRQRLEDAKRAFLDRNPEGADAVEAAVRRGRLFRSFQDRAYQAGNGGSPLKPILEELARSECTDKFEREKVVAAFEKGASARRRRFENASLSDAGPLFDLPESGPHPNFLPSLRPSANWIVLLDDTGASFASDAGGKMAAVFVPDGTKLPDPPAGWHATERSLENGPDSVLALDRALVSAMCGVLGVPVSILPGTADSDRWLSCIEAILEVSLRILPLDGATTLTLFAERHADVDGATGNDMLRRLCDAAMHRLSLSHPERAKKISVEARIVRKDGHPWNGYADAVAFTWGGATASSLLRESGWRGSCLLDRASADLVRRTLSTAVLSPADWTAMLASRESDSDASLLSSLLRSAGEEAQADSGLWRTFLGEAVRHLDSKAIDMALLGRQLRWLKRWEPVDAELPPRTRLMWLAAELAAANHSGRTDLHGSKAFRREFDDLCDRLRREDCPLVAHAKLHLAVSYTNAFEFEKAREMLLPMRDWPVEALGLRMAGRLLSSLGQHAAFLGDPAGALPLFDEAIARFRDLSENSRLEILQTSAYAATASMDAGTPDSDERLASYLWGGPFSEERLVAESRRLATSAEPVEKYSHHILLRRLVELPAHHPARTAYLEENPRWSEPATGHPWELIEFYRALLLPPGTERDARLKSAYDIAMAEGGPTLHVIAAVIAGSAVAKADAPAREAYENFVACCAEVLPALGDARLAVLRGQLNPTTRLDPLDLARAVLPFNFR